MEQVFAMTGILVIPELLSRFLELASVLVALLSHNVSLLLEDSSDIRAKVAPPVSELGVFTRISVENINGINDGLHRGVVGESLQENAELHLGIGIDRVSADVHALSGTLILDVGSTALVSLENINEEIDSVIIVIVLLLFDDDLCKNTRRKKGEMSECTRLAMIEYGVKFRPTLQSVDELVTSLLWELLLSIVLCSVLVLLLLL